MTPLQAASAAPRATADGVGGRIREGRLARGWTQDQLAQAVGVSRSAVAQWETERTGQLRTHFARIAALLDIPLEQLLHGAASRAPAQAATGDELALLRLYRECAPADRTIILQTARRLARVPAHHASGARPPAGSV